MSANLLLAETDGSVRKVEVKLLLWVGLLKGSSLRLCVRTNGGRQKREYQPPRDENDCTHLNTSRYTWWNQRNLFLTLTEKD